MKRCVSCFAVAAMMVLFALITPGHAADSPLTPLVKDFKAVTAAYEAFSKKVDLDVEKVSMRKLCKEMNQMLGMLELSDKRYFDVKSMDKAEKSKLGFMTQILQDFSQSVSTGSQVGRMNEYNKLYKDIQKELTDEQKKEFNGIHEKTKTLSKKLFEEIKKLRSMM